MWGSRFINKRLHEHQGSVKLACAAGRISHSSRRCDWRFSISSATKDSTDTQTAKVKDEFISTVSHELRTPLNTIRLWSRMLASGKIRDTEVIEGGKVIDRAALAQQQLIDDLLDVSRMATGQLRLALRETRLTEALEGAIAAIQPLAESRHIDIRTDLSPEVGVVRVDPDRIQQIVWNLLANAVKFTPERGRVEVRMHRVDATVEIEVVDTGIGIRPDFLPHVFDRFRQGVFLPLERRYTATHSLDTVDNVPVTADLRGIEVLVVEDVPAARDATQRLLESRGAQVRAVPSSTQAIDAFTARRPDVVVADIGMPEEDGYSMIKRLRQCEQEQGTQRVPAVAVTAFAREEDRQCALEAGFDDHLPKTDRSRGTRQRGGPIGNGREGDIQLVPRTRSTCFVQQLP